MSIILWTMFNLKQNMHEWSNTISTTDDDFISLDADNVRAWLLMEILFFFTWISTSILFVAYAYIFKISSMSKSEEIMKVDDNVWNDRSTDDFLRYIKYEYFLFNYVICKGCMQLLIGFSTKNE